MVTPENYKIYLDGVLQRPLIPVVGAMTYPVKSLLFGAQY